MTKKYFFSKLFFWHFLPAERTKAWEGMVSESQVQFCMVNSELLSKIYCVNSNFLHKLRTEIGHFWPDIPTLKSYFFFFTLAERKSWDYLQKMFFLQRNMQNEGCFLKSMCSRYPGQLIGPFIVFRNEKNNKKPKNQMTVRFRVNNAQSM